MVAGVSIKQTGLTLLVHYLMPCISICQRGHLGHSNLLHCSVTLYNFMAGDRFVILLPADGKGKHKLIPQPSPLGGANLSRDNQGRGNGRDNESIANPRPLACLRMLLGENTNDILRNTLLPTISDCTFCGMCHLGMSCFTQCTWVAPYIHSPHVTIDTVVGALTTERLAAEAAPK